MSFKKKTTSTPKDARETTGTALTTTSASSKKREKRKKPKPPPKDPPGVKTIKGTRLLAETLACTTRVLVHQGGTRCFGTGTEVLMADGSYKAIERVEIGDFVATPIGGATLVLNSIHYSPASRPVVLLTVAGVDGHLVCTPDHRFRVGAKWVEAKDLKKAGHADVTSVVHTKMWGPVYDLETGAGEYIVTRARLVCHNSSKTYSIAQAVAVMFVAWYSQNVKKTITIARKRMPSLKATAMKDVLEILKDMGLYDERFHNKTDNIYKLGRVEIEFLSTDDPQKIRGRKRDVLWLNEANEFSYEDFLQFSLRTTEKIILDYNPSDEYHWIYDYVLTRDDVTFIKSTYRDNPFLGAETIKEIERLKDIDPVAWKVYGEGERGASVATVFPNFEIVKDMPEEAQSIYGLDFGYNEPSAFVEVRVVEDEMYLNLLLYKRKLTNADIANKVKDLIDGTWVPIYCDSANPDRVEELWRFGLNVHPADKKPYSVKAGLDFMKRHKIYVTESSVDLIKEMRHYKWLQDRDGGILDMPLKQNDHAIDAARYAIYTHYGRPVSWLMADESDGAAYHIIDET